MNTDFNLSQKLDAVQRPVRRMFAIGAIFGLVGGFLAALLFVLPIFLIKPPRTMADLERSEIRELAYREGYVDGATAQRDGESLKYPVNAQSPRGNP